MRRNVTRGTMKTVLILLAIIVLSISVTAGPAEQSIQVYKIPMQFTFDEMKLAPPADQQGFIHNNTTYLPLRFVVHSLNQAVGWDGATSTVTIYEPESHERVEIDAYNSNNQTVNTNDASAVTNAKPALAPTSIRISPRKVTYKIGGETIIPASGLEGFIINDRLFVPLRFVSTSIGYEVDWDQSTYSVAMRSPAYIAQKQVPLEETVEDLQEVLPSIPSGGGGGAVITAPPSESSIISQADGQISSLRASCQSSLVSLYIAYKAETDPVALQALMSQGLAQLAQCDTQFEALMTSLENSLSANGYSTSIVATYRASYAAEKTLAESLLN